MPNMSQAEQEAYALVLNEIEKCRLNGKKERTLHITGRNLHRLPPEIGELTELKELVISHTRITCLPPEIGKCKSLVSIRAHNNRIVEIPPEIENLKSLVNLRLFGNRLTSLPKEIVELSSLTALSIGNNRFQSLPSQIYDITSLRSLLFYRNEIKNIPQEICKLINLSELYVNSNKFGTFPSAICGLVSLKRLSINDAAIIALPPTISKLKLLRELDLSRNFIETLPSEIGRLSELRILRLHGNNLRGLPIEIADCKALTALHLHNNPRLGIPSEVLGAVPVDVDRRVASPANPKDVLEYYFRIAKSGSRKSLNECKLILVGRGSVGKTTLVHQLVHQRFIKKSKTKGIQVSQWQTPGPEGVITAHVWDFGGQEIMHGTHQFFLTERSLYLLVLAGREDREDEDAEYWLKMIRAFGADSPVIVVLNKFKEHRFDLNEEMLREKYPNIVGFIETDCKTNFGIRKLRKRSMAEIKLMDSIRSSFPVEWFQIKQRLTNMPENFMSYESFRELCKEYGETRADDQDELARFLHILGVALNFRSDPRLCETSVLNPRWVTNGIYKILNDDIIRKKGGVVRISDLTRVLPKASYPLEMHDFLVRLMKKFDLCFPLDESERQYLFPELLGKKQPRLTGQFTLDECLSIDYAYGTLLPEGLLPRFIVRAYTLIADDLRWRTGVVLKWKDAHALVKADEAERQIFIRVKGELSDRRELLALIRIHFNFIHQNFNRLHVEERLHIPEFLGVIVTSDELITAAKMGQKSFSKFHEGEGCVIQVQSTMDLFDIRLDRSRARGRRNLQEMEESR